MRGLKHNKIMRDASKLAGVSDKGRGKKLDPVKDKRMKVSYLMTKSFYSDKKEELVHAWELLHGKMLWE